MFQESTDYEKQIIAERIAADEFSPVALHRIALITHGTVMRVIEQTNDDNDDGYPDGAWESWESEMNIDTAMKYAGVCRVGVSGVIVTVTLDGKELK